MSTTQAYARPALGRFGLGAGSLGNLYREVTDEDARAVIDRAWQSGVRYFDTAPHYGLGLSERRLGAALAARPRDEYVLSTKVGRILEPSPSTAGQQDDEGFAVPATHQRRWDFSADGVVRSLEDSLTRLGHDRVDVLYLHDPEDHLEQAIEEALPALVELRSNGVVGAIGVGSKDAAAMTALVQTGCLDLVMVAGRYTLLEQPALEELFPAAQATGTGVVAVGVFNSGLLASSAPSPDSTYEYGPVPIAVLERARRLAAVCEGFGVALPHAAVQFALSHPLVVNVTVGVGKPHHVASSTDWTRTPVPIELWEALEAEGLIPEGVTHG